MTPQRAAEWIDGILGDAFDDDAVRLLLDVAPSTWRRWRAGRGISTADNAARLATVAATVIQLRGCWTQTGIVAWFDRARHQLDGQRPADLLDDPAEHDRVIELARLGRESIAT